MRQRTKVSDSVALQYEENMLNVIDEQLSFIYDTNEYYYELWEPYNTCGKSYKAAVDSVIEKLENEGFYITVINSYDAYFERMTSSLYIKW